MGKVAAQFFSGARVGFEGAFVEKNKADQLDRLWILQNIRYRMNGDFGRGIHGIPECSGRDRREAHAGAVSMVGLFNGVAIAALKDLRLIACAALPHRANSVDHVSRLPIRAGGASSL